MIYWREPLLLWLMLLPLAIVPVSILKEKTRQAKLVDPELLPWIQPTKRSRQDRLTPLLVLSAWILLVLALAGPRTPQFTPNDLSSATDRVVILLDYSDSMRAIDAVGPQGVVPRITAATQLANSWLDQDEQIVETGLVAYSGRAHWILKPTVDSNLIQHFLAQGDALYLPTLGSNVVDALSTFKSLTSVPERKTHIILLTDGDVALEKRESLETALLDLHASMPMTLNLIGMGGEEPVQVPGHPTAATRLESTYLKALASLHQDFNYRSSSELLRQPLMEWLSIQSKRITPENYDRVLWFEWFSIPLLLAVSLILLLIRRSQSRRSDG